ncbi:hypothetical protein TELCIR_06005 [Teladorsagia circumcincta]|uniref:Uncharacterized protein n=1 Tax=Teladorsagia circumcincta TaxID=45464 RepID=A0A2G9UPI6_TELCI|nr:hypothetical protein TELCIR_06005 [Teladorsagia circumcincta]
MASATGCRSGRKDCGRAAHRRRSLRPPLPPPLTPLFFFCMACCRAGGQLGGMMSTYPDHPDVDHRERLVEVVRMSDSDPSTVIRQYRQKRTNL